jgi:hypothetical protein
LGFELRHKRGAVIEEHEFHVVEYIPEAHRSALSWNIF